MNGMVDVIEISDSCFPKDILARSETTIDSDGQQTHDFIYVDDLCRTFLLALDNAVSGEVFQIVTGVETSIEELAALVRGTVGLDVKMQHRPARQGASGRITRRLGKHRTRRAANLIGQRVRFFFEKAFCRLKDPHRCVKSHPVHSKSAMLPYRSAHSSLSLPLLVPLSPRPALPMLSGSSPKPASRTPPVVDEMLTIWYAYHMVNPFRRSWKR